MTCLLWQRKINVGDSLLKLALDMSSWFKAFRQKTKKGLSSPRQPLDDAAETLSSSSSSPPAVRNSNPPISTSTNRPKQGPTAGQVNISNTESVRWSKPYDVCICHNEGDLDFVEKMVSYLESQPEHFRCFLQPRDAVPGGAIVTELCDAVLNSHCWVLVITPNFLKDPWCRYQMHQALTESPMANGRTIPVLKDVDRRDYPRELRCIYYISVTLWEMSFKQIRETITRYLQELCQTIGRRD